jgi:hypothetical protein
LPLQTLGLVGFGAAAGAALVIPPALGAYLVAAGLLVHAAWDIYHHRTYRVVLGSLAEFCLALDAALAVAIVIVTGAEVIKDCGPTINQHKGQDPCDRSSR